MESDVLFVVEKIKKWLLQNLNSSVLPKRSNGKNFANLILPLCCVIRSIDAQKMLDWLELQQVICIQAGKVFYNDEHPFMNSLMSTSDDTYDSIVLSRVSMWLNKSKLSLPSSSLSLKSSLQQIAQSKIPIPAEMVLQKLAQLEYVNIDESGNIHYFGEDSSMRDRQKRKDFEVDDELEKKKACVAC
jgi:hypothetical protein